MIRKANRNRVLKMVMIFITYKLLPRNQSSKTAIRISKEAEETNTGNKIKINTRNRTLARHLILILMKNPKSQSKNINKIMINNRSRSKFESQEKRWRKKNQSRSHNFNNMGSLIWVNSFLKNLRSNRNKINQGIKNRTRDCNRKENKNQNNRKR